MNVRGSGWEARSRVGVGKPEVKKTFRFKISFNSPGCPLCFPVQNPDPPASHPSLPLEGFFGGGRG